jgi:hypothetical protein
MRIPLHCLVTEEYPENSSIELMFNKPGHGLNRDQLLACLIGLFQSRFIYAKNYGEDTVLTPTNEQIITACDAKRFDDDIALFYGLTEAGGQAWEAFALPAWDRFISEDYDSEDHTATVICADRRRLEWYLRCEELNLSTSAVVSDTVEITEIADWQATYWKRLPRGFSASFKWSEAPLRHDPMAQLAFGGFCAERDSWYRWH